MILLIYINTILNIKSSNECVLGFQGTHSVIRSHI